MEKDKKYYDQFLNLTFEDFKDFANDKNLSKYEKIGFPDSYRKEFETHILKDIISKLELEQEGQIIVDIGCGCSGLANMLIDFCREKKHKLILVDSEEMLSLLPDSDCIEKIPAKFPSELEKFNHLAGEVDKIIVYSIMQHVIMDSNPFDFIDKSLELLAGGGKLLIGDIPNISKRNRFFSSNAGIKCHQEFTKSDEIPKVEHFGLKHNKIDDGIVFGILQRYRNFGLESYLLPQPDSLPMHTRREDIIIVKP